MSSSQPRTRSRTRRSTQQQQQGTRTSNHLGAAVGPYLPAPEAATTAAAARTSSRKYQPVDRSASAAAVGQHTSGLAVAGRQAATTEDAAPRSSAQWGTQQQRQQQQQQHHTQQQHKQQQHGQTPGGTTGSSSWQKVLWQKQPFPDNYTDSSFLKHLVVNADVPERDFWMVVLGSAAVSQQLATVVAAVSVPVHLRLRLMSGQALLLLNVLMLLIGYVVCGLLGKHVLGGSLLRGVRQVALLSGGVYLMSPMLHSLTRNVSEDSVIAMIVGLCLTHLCLHDYNFVNSVTEQLRGTLSLGAAVFASVLFASGMPSEFDVVYLLSPFVRRYVRSASLTAHVLLTAGMVAASLLLLLPLSRVLSLLYVLVVFSVSFVCPYWLVHIQKFKAKINGPWDEAVPRIPTSLHAR